MEPPPRQGECPLPVTVPSIAALPVAVVLPLAVPLRLPVAKDRLGLGEVARRPNDEDAVVQRQLDEVHDQRAIVEHQCATGFVWSCIHVTDNLLISGAPRARIIPRAQRDDPVAPGH